MTWLVAGPFVAAVVVTLAWLSRGPYKETLISELPGLAFILAAGKPYRSQARQIMASRARYSGPAGAFRQIGAERSRAMMAELTHPARDPAVVALDAEMDAVVAMSAAALRTWRPAGADLCAIHGAHVYSVGEPDCTICHEASWR